MNLLGHEPYCCSKLFAQVADVQLEAEFSNARPGVTDADHSITELSTNFRYVAPLLNVAPIARTGRGGQFFNMSYVNGSHRFQESGSLTEQGLSDSALDINHPDDTSYFPLNERPALIFFFARRLFQQDRMNLELQDVLPKTH